MDYKDTLLMPNTSFSMRGNLPENEKLMREKWEKLDLYNKIVEKIKIINLLFYTTVHHMPMVIFILVMR